MRVRGIDATYYTVLDLDAAATFYSKLLGEPAIIMPGRMAEWVLGDGGAFGIYRAEGKSASRSGSVMFAVDDIDTAIRDCAEAGIELDDHVTDTPVCRMVFGNDPEGNQFILHQRRA